MATKQSHRRRAARHSRRLAAAGITRPVYIPPTNSRCIACDLAGVYPPGVPAAPHTCGDEVTTPDGYRFTRQPDGSYTDGDLSFDSDPTGGDAA